MKKSRFRKITRSKKSNKSSTRKRQSGGACLTISNDDGLDYLQMFIPYENIIEFCNLWIHHGGNVCLNQGKKQGDSIYLSLHQLHDSNNHIHLYNFKSDGTASAKDKKTGQIQNNLRFNNNTYNILGKQFEMLLS